MKKLIDKILKKFGYYTLQDIQKGSVNFNNKIYRVKTLQTDYIVSKVDYEDSYCDNDRLDNKVIGKLKERIYNEIGPLINIKEISDYSGGKRFKAKLIVLESENK